MLPQQPIRIVSSGQLACQCQMCPVCSVPYPMENPGVVGPAVLKAYLPLLTDGQSTSRARFATVSTIQT